MKQIKIRPEFEAIVTSELVAKVASANRYNEMEERLSKYEAGDTSVMDEELFAYVMRHHDWYADYSDDGSVYRAAHKQEQFFDSIVENCPKLAGMLETAKATRRSPQLDGVVPYKVFFQPLEMLCLDGDDTDPISVERWMLLAQFRTVERREAANNDAQEGRETADVFFAFAHDALADLLGAGRVDIALI